MSLSNHYKDMALVQKHAMRMGNRNPYHSGHIDQFCAYADLVAESVKAEILEALPRHLKSPKWQVEVDENSLRIVQQKINKMLDGLFSRR